MIGFKLLSFNVNGLRSPSKRRAIFKTLRLVDADIIFLQETHSTIQDQKIWASEWGGRILFSHSLSNSRGVLILFKRAYNPKVLNTVTDHEGRFLVVQLQCQTETITLINVYAPTQSETKKQLAFMDTFRTIHI